VLSDLELLHFELNENNVPIKEKEDRPACLTYNLPIEATPQNADILATTIC